MYTATQIRGIVMRRTVVDHEVLMLAALHGFLTKAPSPPDGRKDVSFASSRVSLNDTTEHVVDRFMQRQLATGSRQVREKLDECGNTGGIRERILAAMRLMYGYGGVQVDLRDAFRMFLECAEVDQTGLAHCYVGAFYRGGWACPTDLEQTAEYFRRGAALGSALCKANLGLLYHKGPEKMRNLPEAMRLFLASAALGCAHGANNAAVMLLEKSWTDPVGIAFLKQAADLGECDACYSVFLMKREKEPHEAARYLLKSRELTLDFELSKTIERAIKTLERNNSDALVPYGYWEPRPKVHKWVCPTIWREMQMVLMMRKRSDSLFRPLARDVVFDICFWLCTFPRPEQTRAAKLTADLLADLL
jgi:hypothetical protein